MKLKFLTVVLVLALALQMFAVVSFADPVDFGDFIFDVVPGTDTIVITAPADTFAPGEMVSVRIYRGPFPPGTLEWIDQYAAESDGSLIVDNVLLMNGDIDADDEFNISFGATSLDNEEVYEYSPAVPTVDEIQISIEGPATLEGNGAIGEYTVKVLNAKEKLAAVTFTIGYPAGKFDVALDASDDPIEEVLGDWTTLADSAYDKDTGDFLGWTYDAIDEYYYRTITLVWFGGAAIPGDYDLFKFSLAMSEDVDTTETVAVIVKDGTTSLGGNVIELGLYNDGEAETELIPYSIYDVNRDGTVDLADVACAAFFYMAEDTDGDWEDKYPFEIFGTNPVEYLWVPPCQADVNGDGVVDIEDMILIMENYD